MADEEPPPKDEGGGVPGWVVTFSDLMSLLLAFFVLLFSFSELEKSKFKQVGGSLKEAFGVQQEIKVKDPLKGLSIIALEFSPGRPDPTKLNEVRQSTTNTFKRYVDARTRVEVENEKLHTVETELRKLLNQLAKELQQEGEDLSQLNNEAARLLETLDQGTGGRDGEGKGQAANASGQIESEAKEFLRELAQEITTGGGWEGLEDKGEGDVGQGFGPAGLGAASKGFRDGVRQIRKELAEEIQSGTVEIETEGPKLTVRIKEKGTFASGSADLLLPFKSIIAKMSTVFKNMGGGEIVVAGHTDNRPINTTRFRSNWELSAGRAVTVVHELIKRSGLPEKSFQVEGYGATRPVDTNDNSTGRARNRRVEVIIVQGDDIEKEASVEDKELETGEWKTSEANSSQGLGGSARGSGVVSSAPAAAPKPAPTPEPTREPPPADAFPNVLGPEKSLRDIGQAPL